MFDSQNPYALLRNALPISNKEIRVVQLALESISEDLRVPGVRFSGSAFARALALEVGIDLAQQKCQSVHLRLVNVVMRLAIVGFKRAFA